VCLLLIEEIDGIGSMGREYFEQMYKCSYYFDYMATIIIYAHI